MKALAPVDFTVTPEQTELAATVRSLLARHTPEAPYGAEVTLDRDVVRRLGSELGVLGIELPDAIGGGGGSLAEMIIVGAEAGHARSSAPLIPLAIASHLLAQRDPERLASLLAGSAIMDVIGAYHVGPRSLTATPGGAETRLTGEGVAAFGDGAADAYLVIASTPDGDIAALVDGSHRRHSVRRASSLDLTRPWVLHSFAECPAVPLTAPGETAILGEALDIGRLAVAADQVGIADWAVSNAVEYAKVRYQFGRAIGSQQAIKHRLVDMSVMLERARSAIEYAARCQPETRGIAALAALETADTAAQQTTLGAIQVFGGIGMTWEHEAHLYLRRAMTNEALFGAPEVLRRQLAERLWPAGH